MSDKTIFIIFFTTALTLAPLTTYWLSGGEMVRSYGLAFVFLLSLIICLLGFPAGRSFYEDFLEQDDE